MFASDSVSQTDCTGSGRGAQHLGWRRDTGRVAGSNDRALSKPGHQQHIYIIVVMQTYTVHEKVFNDVRCLNGQLRA